MSSEMSWQGDGGIMIQQRDLDGFAGIMFAIKSY